MSSWTSPTITSAIDRVIMCTGASRVPGFGWPRPMGRPSENCRPVRTRPAAAATRSGVSRLAVPRSIGRAPSAPVVRGTGRGPDHLAVAVHGVRRWLPWLDRFVGHGADGPGAHARDFFRRRDSSAARAKAGAAVLGLPRWRWAFVNSPQSALAQYACLRDAPVPGRRVVGRVRAAGAGEFVDRPLVTVEPEASGQWAARGSSAAPNQTIVSAPCSAERRIGARRLRNRSVARRRCPVCRPSRDDRAGTHRGASAAGPTSR